MQTLSQHSPHPFSECATKITLVAELWQEARKGKKLKAFLWQPVPALHWHLPGASEPSSQTERNSLPLEDRRSKLSAPGHHFLFIYLFIYIVVVFVIHWHESAMDLRVFPILIPPPTSLSTRSLWVFPVHQARALVSCIQPGLVICFTLDNIHILMLFSWSIPPSPSPTESKSLFCTSVSLFLFCV